VREINFSGIPLFRGLDRVDLAKLLPSLEKMTFRAEVNYTELYDTGTLP
jgi:hypothetical protein